jgi:hypothetical protein
MDQARNADQRYNLEYDKQKNTHGHTPHLVDSFDRVSGRCDSSAT